MRKREPASGEMRPQSHGGALLPGGQPGNRGGSGAPPSAIRSRCRESFLSRIAIAERIADDESQDARDRLKALELLARLGLGSLEAGAISDHQAKRDEIVAAGGSEYDAMMATLY
jgi:hypothetical protein